MWEWRGWGRGEFLCGLDRDELECSNVREMANPHLPFPRARAYAGKRGVGKDKGSRLRWRKTGNARGAYVCTRCVCPGAVCHAHSCDLQLMKLGCSRVACQINMSPILPPPPPPASVPPRAVQSPPSADYLPSLPSSSSALAQPFLAALLRESSSYRDRCRLPPRTLTLSRTFPSPLPTGLTRSPFRLQV